MLGTVCKAGDVMDLFTARAPDWGVSEVADAMGMPKSSAHDMLSTLSEIGLVRRTYAGRYRLGWRVLQMHQALVSSTGFLDPSQAVIAHLADTARVTVHVAALRKHEVIYLDKVTGAGAPDLSLSGVGLVVAAHCTGIGKMLLSDREPAFAGEVAARFGLPRRTSNTITRLDALHEELASIRQLDVAQDHEEAAAGVSCIAVPIRDTDGSIQAAISAAMPTRQFERLQVPIRRQLRAAASKLASQGTKAVRDTARLIRTEGGAA